MSSFFHQSVWESRLNVRRVFFPIIVAQLIFVSSNVFSVSNQIAAIVDNDVVSESELLAKERLIQADPSNPLNRRVQAAVSRDEVREILLDSMVSDLVQRQYAQKIGLSIPQRVIDREVQKIASTNNFSLDQFEQAMTSAGVDWGLFKREIETRIIVQRLVRDVVASNVEVSDFEVEEFFRQSGVSDASADRFTFNHLLVKLREVDGAKVSSEKEDSLVKLVQELKVSSATPEQFKLNAQRLANESLNIEFTEVGARKTNQLPNLFIEEFAELNVGDVSEVLRSSEALHLLLLVDKESLLPEGQEKRKLAHILVSAVNDDEARVAAMRLNNIRERSINGESFAKLASQNSDDSNSAAIGGDLGWVNRGDTVPSFEKAAFALTEVGMVTRPVRTRFGVHIVKLLDVAKQDRGESMKALAKRNISAQKASQQYPIWLNGLISQAYVLKYSNPNNRQ